MSLSLSLSLSFYIYIYIYVCVCKWWHMLYDRNVETWINQTFNSDLHAWYFFFFFVFQRTKYHALKSLLCVLIYPNFHIYPSYSQVHHNLSLYIYIYKGEVC